MTEAPYRETRGGRWDTIHAGPFVEWLDAWIARQDAMRYSGWSCNEQRLRPVATLEDLAELAGCNVRSLWRVRTTGRVSVTLVDRVLIAAGGDVLLSHLYPDLGVAA